MAAEESTNKTEHRQVEAVQDAGSGAQVAAGEFTVYFSPKLEFWEYFGTRAQLEAEGVIPLDTEWPDGAQSCFWDVGRYRYWLRRIRPEGIKGPMSVWTSGNWWSLRCTYGSGMSGAVLYILEKQRALAKALDDFSPAGQRARDALWQRYRAANADKAFQAFKAAILPTIPARKKPGRKPKLDQA